MKKKFGVYYLYDQNPYYHEMCLVSIASLKKIHPDWEIEVMRTKSFSIQWWRKIYRFLTPWKNHLRRNRAGQDTRMFVEKAKLLTKSPFETTLFLDVDTIIRKPLDHFKELSATTDLIICPIPWLKYEGIDETMPKQWPAVNVGVMFFSEKFSRLYEKYIQQYHDQLHRIDMVDQYFASLICHLHRDELNIQYAPHLQIDVVDAHHHLNDEKYHVKHGLLDMNDSKVLDFHIFHYNEYKRQYIDLIKNTAVE